MIDLRGAVARRHDDVVKSSVDLIVQVMPAPKLGALSPSQPLKRDLNIFASAFENPVVPLQKFGGRS